MENGVTAPHQPELPAPIIDDFNGNDAKLIDCAKALIHLSDSGSMAPHGIGGHARAILSAFIVRMQSQPATPEPTYTTGHCEEHRKPGGCQLHNLHCGWPACDRKPVDETTAKATHAASRPADGDWRTEIEAILSDAARGGPPVGRDWCCLDCGKWTPINHPEAHAHDDDCTAEAEWRKRLNWQSRLHALLASAPTSAQSSVSDGQCQQLVLDGQNGARRCLFKPAHGDTLCKRHRVSAEATGYEPSRTIEPTPDSAALADTQRAIIEAAEARGYERAIRELSSNPGTQSSNPSALSSELDAAARATFSAGDAVFAFSAMLTSLPHVVPFGASAWATPGADLAAAFNEANGLSVSRDFPHGLKFPEMEGRLLDTVKRASKTDEDEQALTQPLTTPSDAGGEPIAWAATDYQADGPNTQYTSDRYAAEYYESIGLDVRPLYAATPPNPGDARLLAARAEGAAAMRENMFGQMTANATLRALAESWRAGTGADLESRLQCADEILSLLDGKGVAP